MRDIFGTLLFCETVFLNRILILSWCDRKLINSNTRNTKGNQRVFQKQWLLVTEVIWFNPLQFSLFRRFLFFVLSLFSFGCWATLWSSIRSKIFSGVSYTISSKTSADGPAVGNPITLQFLRLIVVFFYSWSVYMWRNSRS